MKTNTPQRSDAAILLWDRTGQPAEPPRGARRLRDPDEAASPPPLPPSPGGSTITDDQTTYPSSPAHLDHDPRNSLQHVLGNTHQSYGTPTASRQNDLTEDDEATPGPAPTTAAKTGSSRRKKDPAIGTSALNNAIYSGNKVRHLKKDDGEPLWRKDIQYDFLRLVFENDQAVFTNSYEPDTLGKQTFADFYIDAMARSSKTSKILRDKLLTEHEPAKNMAMVCLLVNLGRMNTTLNCECYEISCFFFLILTS